MKTKKILNELMGVLLTEIEENLPAALEFDLGKICAFSECIRHICSSSLGENIFKASDKSGLLYGI